jgi:hypothetical protein
MTALARARSRTLTSLLTWFLSSLRLLRLLQAFHHLLERVAHALLSTDAASWLMLLELLRGLL